MNVFWVMNGKKLRRYIAIVAAAIFAGGVIYAEKENVSVFSYDEPSAIYSVETSHKVVALTFDISWGEERTAPILDALKEQQVEKATFFLSAPWAKDHPDIVQRIVDEGFEIGSHGHQHTNYSELEDEEIRKQIRTAHHLLSEATGQNPNLIRLPNGDFDKRVLRIAHEQGYKVIQWHTDSQDWKNPGVEQIVRNVVDNVHPGDIVLLHASDSSQQTHQALPEIIETLRDEGYRFVTVSELINHTGLQQTEVRDVVPQQRQPKS